MKLHNIGTIDESNLVSSIRTLLNNSTHVPLNKVGNHETFQQLFLESAIQTKLMSEADLTNLQAMLKAGIARLKSALTPGTSSDLDILMAFMAPGVGGSKSIESLLNSAKLTDKNLGENDEWWDEYFSTFKIDDYNIQKDIRNQVADEVGQQSVDQDMLRKNGTLSPYNSDAERGGNNQNSQDSQGRQEKGPFDEEDIFSQEIQNSDEWRKQLLDAISKGKAGKQTASNKLRDLNAKLDQLLKNAPRSEGFIFPITDMLLEYKSVQNNIHLITNNVISVANCKYGFNIPTINENGLLNKLRTMMANPKYANRLLNKSTNTDTNIQAAKLAIRIATDHLRDKFNIKLKSAGLSPSEIIKTYIAWKKLKSSNGDKRTILELENKLKSAFKLFDIGHKTTSKTKPEMQSSDSPVFDDDNDNDDDPLSVNRSIEANPEGALINIDEIKAQIATSILEAMRETAMKGGDLKEVYDSGKRIAKKAYKINPDVTKECWRVIKIWLKRKTKN